MFKLVPFSLLFVFCFCLNLKAQETSLRLVLIDQNGAAVTNSIVQLQDSKGKLIKEFANQQLQIVNFSHLIPGEYILRINSVGFKSFTKNIFLKEGTNDLNIVLEIEQMVVNVDIKRSKQEIRLDEFISKDFTAEEIEALPDTPEDIKSELQRRYGDDVVIRINGFTGGQMPSKEQIASIKVIRSSFDAEFHDIGQTIVDIKTKAGGNKWFGFFRLDFSNYRLNARNAFFKARLPQQTVNFVGFLVFPTFKKTSLSASLLKLSNFNANNFIAISPDKEIPPRIRTETSLYVPFLTITHNINAKHTINTSYFLTKNKVVNSGIGELNLPERAFSSNLSSNIFQLSEIGTLKKKYVNQFYFQFLSVNSNSVPAKKEPAIITVGFFSKGGATINNQSNQRNFSLRDNFFFDFGKQSIKFGGEIKHETQNLKSADNINGTFIFLTLEDYQNNKPYQFSQRRNISEVTASQIQGAIFFQNDIRLKRNFQIGIGLRYELQNNLRDSNNFSPRLSFVWSPDKEAKFVVRSGAGIFYQWLDTSPLSTILGNDGRRGSDLIIINPGYPDPSASGTTGDSLPPSIIKKDDNLKNPYTFISKTGLNYRINSKLNLETIYTFRRGVHQFRSRDINAPINGQRPDTAFGRITQVESSGNLTENSLELKLDATLRKGFFFDANYKLGRIVSDFNDIFSLPTDSYNLGLDRAYSNLDQRHRFNSRFVFPSWKKFSFSSVFRLESPRPYTITTGFDNNGDSVLNDRPFGIERNSERGDWFKQVDADLSWRTKFGKVDEKNPSSNLKNRMVFNIAVKNLFNQTNKQNFIGIQTSPFFQQATTTSPARTVQGSITYLF